MYNSTTIFKNQVDHLVQLQHIPTYSMTIHSILGYFPRRNGNLNQQNSINKNLRTSLFIISPKGETI